jgi:hypothetical protein
MAPPFLASALNSGGRQLLAPAAFEGKDPGFHWTES